MQINNTIIKGCYEILPQIMTDNRGLFVKTYHVETFSDNCLNTVWNEEYYSVSNNNVLRGLHFQTPPYDHEKLVYCSSGTVLDCVVDLRKASVTFGKHMLIELSAEKANMVYIPRGLAHGFYVISENATLNYKVATVYSSSHDKGILWDSAGIAWPCDTPTLSQRDLSFPALKDFDSPF